MLPQGSNYCGKVEVLDIGVPITEYTYQTLKEPTFKKRLHNSHKGTYGTALLICGSYGMAGALMLAAKSSLRSGLGIVKCLIPKSIYIPFTRFLPEAVCLPFKETRKGTIKFNLKFFKKHIDSADSVLFGPGIGKHKENLKILRFLLKTDKPLVIDADGINTLSQSIDLLRQCKAPVILTPHPAEMSRMIKVPVNEIEANRPKFAIEFAKKYGCTLILKGSNTIVADKNGNVFFNIIGNNGMATGGSGDVLAGITTSFLAQGYSPEDSAKFAVYVHSFAADKAAKKRSHHALLPTDIIEEL
jgi:NAD(P)H-hydrate epimerase